MKYLMLLLTIPAYILGTKMGVLTTQLKIQSDESVTVYLKTTCVELAEDNPDYGLIEKGVRAECYVRTQR